MHRPSLTRFAWLSIAAAVLTISLKMAAYLVTDSVGLLSDALESVVNLAAALMALAMLAVAARPPDEDHVYGHDKAEYFSSGVEGALILVAAISIGVTAWNRFFNPQPLEAVGLGLGISLLASLVNLGVALVLRRAGQRYNSITLEADSQHLMTDVWTSIGVIVGIGAVALTGWERLDPLIAFLVALNIVWSGVQLVRRSALGLLDTVWPAPERAIVTHILDKYQVNGVQFHALRTRQSASRRFMSVHILVPGQWSVQQGHQLLEQIESEVREALTGVTILTHLEPLEDPVSWQDTQLDRESTPEESPA